MVSIKTARKAFNLAKKVGVATAARKLGLDVATVERYINICTQKVGVGRGLDGLIEPPFLEPEDPWDAAAVGA